MASFTATYTVTLSASDKDHARGEYVLASIVRTSPATLVPEGLQEGEEVVIGVSEAMGGMPNGNKGGNSGSSNPFMPGRPERKTR